MVSSDALGIGCARSFDQFESRFDIFILIGQWSDGGRRRIDVRNVIWIGTSVIGNDLVFEHHASRPNSDTVMSREEYVELMGLVRPCVSAQLGVSVIINLFAVSFDEINDILSMSVRRFRPRYYHE